MSRRFRQHGLAGRVSAEHGQAAFGEELFDRDSAGAEQGQHPRVCVGMAEHDAGIAFAQAHVQHVDAGREVFVGLPEVGDVIAVRRHDRLLDPERYVVLTGSVGVHDDVDATPEPLQERASART